MSRETVFKKAGEDPGGISRYKHEALGWYSFVTCGGCYTAAYEAINRVDAIKKGWKLIPVWGWVCKSCLERLSKESST
jgi:hypothetical protein